MFDLTNADLHTILIAVLATLAAAGLLFIPRHWAGVRKRLDGQDVLLQQQADDQHESKEQLRKQEDILANQTLQIALTGDRILEIQKTLENNFGPNSGGARQQINSISRTLDGVVSTQKAVLEKIGNLDGQFTQHLKDLAELEAGSKPLRVVSNAKRVKAKS